MKICNESVEPETSINKVIKLDIEAKESIYFSKELKLCLATEDQADRFVCDYSNEALAALLGIEDFAKDESEFSNTLDIEHIDYKFTKNHSSNVEDFLDNVTDYKLSDSNQ